VAGLGLGGAAVAMAAGTDGTTHEAAGAPTASAGPARPSPRPTVTPSTDPSGAADDPVDVTPLPDPAWVDRVAAAADAPRTAIASYAGAALQLAAEQPACGLGWNTLAAIGEVESGHGTAGDSVLDERGVATPPVVGPALDGRGVAAIRDTDGGVLDGDGTWDRAVGPMQFIPGSWATWATDGDGDGDADPQNIADAALAAARYLCDAGDLSDAGTWIAAIESYNAGPAYNERVADAADRFAGLG
jgi:membrane-bound lytic murein transglycosylase B